MNKRQRKKMYTRAFSKAYDESLKWQKGKRAGIYNNGKE